jgi:hypothetical protein
MVSAMTEPVIPTKWAALDAIEAAVTDERLLERAMLDFVQEFARYVVTGKTPRQAIAELDSWRSLFEKVRRERA